MEAQQQLRRLAHDLDLSHHDHLARWMNELGARSWNIGRASRDVSAPDPGAAAPPNLIQLLEERCAQFLRTLSRGLRDSDELRPGAPELREPVQILSFAAGWMAGAGLSISDVLALVQGLHAVLPALPTKFVHALEVAACEAHLAAVMQEHRARHRDVIERAQVVCDLDGETPCLFLVGDPDRHALDEAVGRAVTLSVMRGARRLVVDCSALAGLDQALVDVAPILLDYSKEAGVSLAVCGVMDVQSQGIELLEQAEVPLFDDIAAALSQRLATR